MPDLPTEFGDNNVWGGKLNTFLLTTFQADGTVNSDDIQFDNTLSGLVAGNVKAAIEEVLTATQTAQGDATQAISDAAAAQTTADAALPTDGSTAMTGALEGPNWRFGDVSGENRQFTFGSAIRGTGPQGFIDVDVIGGASGNMVLGVDQWGAQGGGVTFRSRAGDALWGNRSGYGDGLHLYGKELFTDAGLNFVDAAEPAAPGANQLKLFTADVAGVSHLKAKDEAGTVTDILGHSGTGVDSVQLGPGANADQNNSVALGHNAQPSEANACAIGTQWEFKAINGANKMGFVTNATADRDYAFPDADGTIALTSDIPAIPSTTNKFFMGRPQADGGSVMSADDIFYGIPSGTKNLETTSNNVKMIVPEDITITKIMVNFTTNDTEGADTCDVRILKNTSSQAGIILDYAGAGTGALSATGSVSVAAGDEIALRFNHNISNPAADDATVLSWAITYTVD